MKVKEILILVVEQFNRELVANYPSSRINELYDWAQSNSKSARGWLALHYVGESYNAIIGTYMKVFL